MTAKKFVMLGDTAVGKSSLCIKQVRDDFYEFNEPTIGAAFLTCSIEDEKNDVTHKLEIWDTAGQERYRALAPMYYRGASAALVLYDVTDYNSFEGAKDWIDELLTKARPNIIIYLVGGKCDLLENSNIKEVNVADFLNKNLGRIHHMYTSAKTGENVNKLFLEAAQKVYECIDEDEDCYSRSLSTVIVKKRHKIVNNSCC